MIGQTTSLAHNQGISQTNTDLMRQQRSLACRRPALAARSFRSHTLPGNRFVGPFRSDILRAPGSRLEGQLSRLALLAMVGKYDKWPPKPEDLGGTVHR